MSSRSPARGLLTAIVIGALATVGLSFVGVPPGPVLLDAGLVAHIAGLLAGYAAPVMVVLMSRVPRLERRVGSDVLARWHGRGGRLFVVLMLVHVAAAVQAWASTRGQNVVGALISVLGLPWLGAASVATGLFLAIAAISVGAARRAVSFETWQAVHLLTYIAIVLAFLHELAGPDLAGHPALQVLWTLLHAYALALVLRFRVLAPLENAWRHRLRVAAVVPEANGVVSLIMHGEHVAELGAEPGQFFRWRFLTTATWRTAHPFSLSAVPSRNYLRITVKALGDGSRLIHAVQPGTLVLAEGPSGALTARKRTRPSVLLIAGGVGITPMRALFESLPISGGKLTLLYRASSPHDIVFRSELEDIARQRGAEIEWMIGPSSAPELKMTGANLRRLVPDIADRDVYLCASPSLSAAVRAATRETGLPRKRLHEEAFAF